jgi:hypothetical protein
MKISKADIFPVAVQIFGLARMFCKELATVFVPSKCRRLYIQKARPLLDISGRNLLFRVYLRTIYRLQFYIYDVFLSGWFWLFGCRHGHLASLFLATSGSQIISGSCAQCHTDGAHTSENKQQSPQTIKKLSLYRAVFHLFWKRDKGCNWMISRD